MPATRNCWARPAPSAESLRLHDVAGGGSMLALRQVCRDQTRIDGPDSRRPASSGSSAIAATIRARRPRDDIGPDDLSRLIFSMRPHSASVTGITERRDMRTSGNDANARSALISASVTGRGKLLVRRRCRRRTLARGSCGSGYASPPRVPARPLSACRCGSRRCGRPCGSSAGVSARAGFFTPAHTVLRSCSSCS